MDLSGDLRAPRRPVFETDCNNNVILTQLRERLRAVETFQGETVWEGEVLVFEFLDHPTAPKCYAWEVDGEVTAVLHEPPVGSAQEAVKAAIMERGNGQH